MKSVLVLGMAAALAACGNVQPFVPDTARLAPGALGSNEEPDVAAANLAQWAFSDSGRTYGRPVEGARAAASMDYLAGQIYTSPRWSNVSAITKEQLLQGRDQVRTALRVVPGAPSQLVVDRLTAAGNALNAGDQAAALAALTSPVFAAGPEQTLATLGNLPYLQMANVATQHLATEMFDGNTRDRF